MGKFTVGSLFSGIGGLDLAAHWAGLETVWFVEKEPFCQKVLAKHWPNVSVHSDVFECHDLPFVDVICGGFPCQPFSVAGNRLGRNDERFLLPEMLRIVDEVKPYAVLFENVPGFPSLNDGTEFKYLLGALAEMGFDAQWGHIRASDVGAPHKRERWFCVAYAVSNGNGIGGRRGIVDNQKRHSSQIERERNNEQFRSVSYDKQLAYTQHDGYIASAITGCDAETVHDIAQGTDSTSEFTGVNSAGIAPKEIMGNSNSGRCEQYNAQQREFRVSNTGCNEPTKRYTTGETQSRLGGTSHGLPGRLDFAGFPSRPGEPQFSYEPPRILPSTKNTNARIKALGNSVVPQVAYPVFQAIAEWLEEIKDE